MAEYTPEEFDKTYQKALKLIKFRPHGSRELMRKLTLRHFNAGAVSAVTEKLTELGLINDRQFEEDFLDSLLRFKTYGYYGLLAKLMQRGIEKNTAENLLREKLSVADEKQIALKVLNKEQGTDKIKLAQKLSRKGFRSQVISEVLNQNFFD